MRSASPSVLFVPACPQMLHVSTLLGNPEYRDQGLMDMSLLNHSQKRSMNLPWTSSVAYQEKSHVVLQAQEWQRWEEEDTRAPGSSLPALCLNITTVVTYSPIV
jgi:hypothetical protein